MSYPYNEINFDVFSEVPEETMTKAEQNRVLKDFYQKAGCYHHKKSHRKAWTGAIAACLVLCLVATPIGDAAWAAMKQAFMGIGEYLGMTKQDDYATVVDQTQTKNGITVTLNDAIGSDNCLRISVTAVKDDGEVLGLSKVSMGDYSINGLNWKNGLKATGTGPYGSKRTGDGGIYFLNTSYVDFEMPLNPTIDMDIWAGEEKFSFSFTLENERFKRATRTVSINKTVMVQGKRLILKDLIVSPIDQIITTENPDNFDPWKDHEIGIYGKDDLGNNVLFSINPFDMTFSGSSRDETKHYEPDPDVSEYRLRVYDYANADLEDLWNPKNAISEEFELRL